MSHARLSVFHFIGKIKEYRQLFVLHPGGSQRLSKDVVWQFEQTADVRSVNPACSFRNASPRSRNATDAASQPLSFEVSPYFIQLFLDPLECLYHICLLCPRCIFSQRFRLPFIPDTIQDELYRFIKPIHE